MFMEVFLGLVTKVLNDNGVDFDFIDTTNLKVVKDSIRDNTKLVHLETPSNPLLRDCRYFFSK